MKLSRWFPVVLLVLCGARLAYADPASDFEAARLKSVAANPPGVSLTLSLPGGRTQFHQGEAIPLTAVFASSLPKAYQLNIGPGNRDLPWSSDSFYVDAPTGAVDPLRLHYSPVLSGGYSGGGPHFQNLDQQPVSISYTLNEWMRFDAPGKYRVYLTSGRAVDAGKQVPGSLRFVGRAATSNSVELEVLPEDPAWSAQALQDALPLYNTDGYDYRIQEAREAAIRTIRFLGTPDAARAMVARYGHYTDHAHWASSPAYYQTRLGLFGFPKPVVVIQEMERRLDDPDFPVFPPFLYDLAQEQFLAAYSPQPLPPPPVGNSPKFGRWIALRSNLQAVRAALADHNWQTLGWAADTKRGKARTISLFTLMQMDYVHRAVVGHQDTAGHQERMRALLPVFDDLTPEEQNSLLDYTDWPQVHSPNLLPLLRRVFASPPPDVEPGTTQYYESYERHSLALRDLTQLSPAEGRTLLLAEIRSPNPRVDLPTLCSLPDRTLPALDGALVTNLENSLQSQKGVWETEPRLVERYATGAILPRVKAAYEANKEKIGGSIRFDLVAYFLRTDRPYGVREVEKALADRQGSGWYKSVLSDVAALFPCPEVEHLAVTHLDDPDVEVAADAAKTLGTYGSVAAEAPLWARLRAWHEQWAGRADQIEPDDKHLAPLPGQLEYALTQVLATAPGWLADRAKLQTLASLCVTEEARRNITVLLPMWAEPIRISRAGVTGEWSVVQYAHLASLAALEDKLAQFPRGTQFHLSRWIYPSATQRAQVLGQLKLFLDKRGMQIDAEPMPPR